MSPFPLIDVRGVLAAYVGFPFPFFHGHGFVWMHAWSCHGPGVFERKKERDYACQRKGKESPEGYIAVPAYEGSLAEA
eukprot:86987-Pelagomonas_calceolata.AAC.1